MSDIVFNGSRGVNDFLDYVEETLIPDTKEAQRYETAKDLQKLVNIAKRNQEQKLNLLTKLKILERKLESREKSLKDYYRSPKIE